MRSVRTMIVMALILASLGGFSGAAWGAGEVLAAGERIYTVTCEDSLGCSCANSNDIVLSGGVECALGPFSQPNASAVFTNHILLDEKGHATGWTGSCGWFSLAGEAINCGGISTVDCYVPAARITVTCLKVR